MILNILGTSTSIIPVNWEHETWVTSSCLAEQNINKQPLDKYDMVFELHNRKTIEKEALIDKVEWEKITCPIIYQDAFFDSYENALKYPLEEALRIAHVKKERYFTNTIAYMIAYALYLGIHTEINLHRVNMEACDEYAHQRPCVEYMIGIAREKGIIVNVPRDGELLFTSHLYGYEQKPINEEKYQSKAMYLSQRRETEKNKLVMYTQQAHQRIGMKKALEAYQANNLPENPDELIKELSTKIDLDLQMIHNAELDLAQVTGFDLMFDGMVKLNGGFK